MINDDCNGLSLDEACQTGICYYQQKDFVEAVKQFSRVIAVEPRHPRALNALAVIEFEKGNYEQAHLWLARLLTAHPDFEKGYNTRGMLFQKQKMLSAAETDFLKAISLNQGFAEAYGNLGNIYLSQRNFRVAADCFKKTVSLNPGIPQVYCGLAKALSMQCLYDEAAVNINLALDLDPDFAPAYLAKGDLMRELLRFSDAIAAYTQALQKMPNAAIYHRSLGCAYRDSGNLSRALECLLEATRLDPTDPLGELSLGSIYWDLDNLHAAEQAYDRGLTLASAPEDVALLRYGLGSVFMSRGLPGKAVAEFRAGLACDPGNLALHSNLLLTMHYPAEVTNEELFRESLSWDNNHAPGSISEPLLSGSIPLRIGFVSADFRVHSVSYFLEPLLASLDRKRFKVYCFSGVKDPDTTTDRLKALTDCWVDCFTIRDDLLADRIQGEQIDILIDLSGHTSNNRLGLFARKPAPIQITWLGYPDTTGLRAMDYRITDLTADPVGDADLLNTEQLIRLADCFLCYQPPLDAPQTLPSPVIDNRFVTFGSFNNLAKITAVPAESALMLAVSRFY